MNQAEYKRRYRALLRTIPGRMERISADNRVRYVIRKHVNAYNMAAERLLMELIKMNERSVEK